MQSVADMLQQYTSTSYTCSPYTPHKLSHTSTQMEHILLYTHHTLDQSCWRIHIPLHSVQMYFWWIFDGILKNENKNKSRSNSSRMSPPTSHYKAFTDTSRVSLLHCTIPSRSRPHSQLLDVSFSMVHGGQSISFHLLHSVITAHSKKMLTTKVSLSHIVRFRVIRIKLQCSGIIALATQFMLSQNCDLLTRS